MPSNPFVTSRAHREWHRWEGSPASFVGSGNFETRTFGFASAFSGSTANDIRLSLLQRPESPGVPFETLSSTTVAVGDRVTRFGTAACPSPAGLRFDVIDWDAPNNTGTCAGDQGGPRFFGDIESPGASLALFGVHSSQGGGHGSIAAHLTEMVNIRQEFDLNGPLDIFLSAWCRLNAEELFLMDLNVDDEPDALCVDRATGAMQVAISNNRLIRPVTVVTGNFCRASTGKLLTGDFNGDGVSDLGCQNSTTGEFLFDFGPDFLGVEVITADTFSGQCIGANEAVHAGDFNGDGSTDLLCHDTFTGDIRTSTNVQGGAIDPFDVGFGPPDPQSFCASGFFFKNTLLVADFSGDGQSELGCHSVITTSPPSTNIVVRDFVGPFLNPTPLYASVPDAADFCARTDATVRAMDLDETGQADLVCTIPTFPAPPVNEDTSVWMFAHDLASDPLFLSGQEWQVTSRRGRPVPRSVDVAHTPATPFWP